MPSNNFKRLREFRQDDYLISTDPSKVKVEMVHNYLTNHSYWAAGVPLQKVKRSLQNSLCFGVYDCSDGHENQIGFARVITDYSVFAYLADVFVLPSYQGRGLGKWLISCILAHPDLQDMRKWMLHTKDAHELYQQFGFIVGTDPETYMIYRPKWPGSADIQLI